MVYSRKVVFLHYIRGIAVAEDVAARRLNISKQHEKLMAEHNNIGRWGEQKAAEYLEQHGFRIIWRDWRDGHRDIDIVAIDADCLVVVEVKTRRNADFMAPEQAVDARKIRNLSLAAAKFVRANNIEMPVRFDIVSVTGVPGGPCEINHIEDAFLPLSY